MSQIIPITRKTSPARSVASRVNGARSKGPATPEGKQVSSRNSLKHALACTSKTPLLQPGEDGDRFRALVARLRAYCGGMPDAEAGSKWNDLVLQFWRAERAFTLENRCLNELARGTEEPDADPQGVYAEAWDRLSYRPISGILSRHLASARTRFRKALRGLS